MRERQKRIARLLKLQDLRLLAEASRCAALSQKADRLTHEIADLSEMLGREDRLGGAFTKLVLERLSTTASNKRQLESDLELGQAAARELKLQMERIDRVSQKIESKIDEQQGQREKRLFLDRYGVSSDVSVE